jgi:DNA-directed RNA polymerase specialized sigma54-like protein
MRVPLNQKIQEETRSNPIADEDAVDDQSPQRNHEGDIETEGDNETEEDTGRNTARCVITGQALCDQLLKKSHFTLTKHDPETENG